MSSAGSDVAAADVAGLSQSRTNCAQLGSACPDGESPTLHLGQEVSIAHFDGTVRFIGETQFATGRWVGIELKEAVGKNNGSVKGVTYFECSPQHGIFVREAVVRPLDAATGPTSARSSAAASEAAGASPATPSEAVGAASEGALAGSVAGTAASSAAGAAASPAGAAAAGGKSDAPPAAEAAAGPSVEAAAGAAEGAKAVAFREAVSVPPSAPASARAASEASAGAAAGAAAEAAADAAAAGAKAESSGAAAGADASRAGDGDSSGSELEMVPVRSLREQRRYGVSAESAARLQNQDAPVWTPPFHQKDPEERSQLSEMIKTSHDSKLQMMFGGIRAAAFEKVVDAMFLKRVPAGEKVIQYGDDGDFFYIVKTGEFDILARRKTGFEEASDLELVKVFEAGAGFSFGELALLYNAPRSATIVATQASEVWCLEREAFRKLVVQSFEDQFREYVDFISRCDIFHELSSEQVASLAEVLEEEDFEEDEAILDQGGRDNKMFIIRRGKAVACIKGDQGEVEVMRYKEGDYFGEIALLLGEPRKANVYAVGPTTCMYITRDTFNRVLGPLRDFMQRNIGKYQKYQDAITTAAQHHDGSSPSGSNAARMSHLSTPRVGSDIMEEVFDGGLQRGGQAEKPKRYRAKTVVLPDSFAEEPEEEAAAEAGAAAKAPEAAAAAGEEGGQKPPVLSLADKVAADFKNPQLVSPCDSFVVPNCNFHMFGGLKLGQKFTHDKAVVARSKVNPTQDGLQDTYSWKGPSWLKGNTQIAVLCQKGQKSASDPTPNQDNYFVLHIGSISIYGVCDGHGPFGHLVSFRLVQTLPHYLTGNPHFGKDWALALKEAFLDAQRDLLTFCAAQDVNVEASGAAGSILVFEGPSIHVAHIGDAGAMIASWNRRDSRLIFGTKDHKPQNPEERARLEAAGSEVRELDKDNFRIYIRGTNFPGLTMSRAFGDTACGGVLQEPEYHTFFMQPGDEYYAIIASDGIWEFLTYEKVVDLSAKKLRLKGSQETVRFLTEASRKRWAYCCGEYCDDITVLLVQWNVKDKSSASDDNHTLTVTREE